MKRQTILLTLPIILSGCVAATSAPVEIPQTPEVIEVAPLLQEDSSADLFADVWEQTVPATDADFCKVPDQRPAQFLGQARGHTVDGVTYAGPSGFPLVEQTVPTQGQLDWLIVMVSFKDTPKYVDSPSDFLETHAQKLEAWADHWSQGNLSFNITYLDYWIDLPVNAMDRPRDDGVLANMIVDGMPEGMHPDDYDATFVQWADLAQAPGVLEATQNNQIKFTLRMGSNEKSYQHLAERPKLLWAPGVYHSSDERQPLSLKREFTYGHFLHEILHEMGLNLHAPGNGWATGVGQALYPNSQGWSAAVNAWETFQLEWLDDSQVHCVDRNATSSTKTILTPIDLYGGERKMVAVPTNNELGEVIVVEARQQGPWTFWSEEEAGLLVYRVDPTAEHRDHVDNDCGNDPSIKKWAYYIYADGVSSPEPNCGFFDKALIKAGQTVTFEGVAVTLEGVVDDGYYVSLNID